MLAFVITFIFTFVSIPLTIESAKRDGESAHPHCMDLTLSYHNTFHKSRDSLVALVRKENPEIAQAISERLAQAWDRGHNKTDNFDTSEKSLDDQRDIFRRNMMETKASIWEFLSQLLPTTVDAFEALWIKALTALDDAKMELMLCRSKLAAEDGGN